MPLEQQETQARNDIVRSLVAALDLHDPGEGGHAERVAVYATATAHALGVRDENLLMVRWAATLHDVGKVSVDAELLRKLGRLNESELAAIRRHSEMAVQALESIEWLRPAIPMIRHHHERWAGQGYPAGLSGEAIPLGARVIAVAETFDALTASLGWRERWTEEAAIAEIRAEAGTQFDPAVVEAFLRVQPLIQPVDA